MCGYLCYVYSKKCCNYADNNISFYLLFLPIILFGVSVFDCIDNFEKYMRVSFVILASVFYFCKYLSCCKKIYLCRAFEK